MKHPAPDAQEHSWPSCQDHECVQHAPHWYALGFVDPNHVCRPHGEAITDAFVPPATAKQPEQTAPEARRWDNRAWVLSGAIVNGADGLTDQEAIAEAIAAYHDAAMEQAKKDRETLERIEAICRFDQKWNQAEWSRERLAIYRALKSES